MCCFVVVVVLFCGEEDQQHHVAQGNGCCANGRSGGRTILDLEPPRLARDVVPPAAVDHCSCGTGSATSCLHTRRGIYCSGYHRHRFARDALKRVCKRDHFPPPKLESLTYTQRPRCLAPKGRSFLRCRESSAEVVVHVRVVPLLSGELGWFFPCFGVPVVFGCRIYRRQRCFLCRVHSLCVCGLRDDW